MRVGWLLLSLSGCVPQDFPAGTWRLAEWSVVVGEPAAPSFEEHREDAGWAELEGDGTWWESLALVELPLFVALPEPQVVPQHDWVYWTFQRSDTDSGYPELWLAWYQAYGTPVGVIALSDHDEDHIVGDASYQLGSSSVGLTDVRTHWVFEREAP